MFDRIFPIRSTLDPATAAQLARYIGLPYEYPDDPPHSYDCWSLCGAIRRELGLVVPDERRSTTLDRLAVDAGNAIASGRWRRCETAEWALGSIILLGQNRRHCAVAIAPSEAMHAYAADGLRGSVRWDNAGALLRLFGSLEVWRHASDY